MVRRCGNCVWYVPIEKDLGECYHPLPIVLENVIIERDQLYTNKHRTGCTCHAPKIKIEKY